MIANTVANTGTSGRIRLRHVKVSRNQYPARIREATNRAMQIGSAVHPGEKPNNVIPSIIQVKSRHNPPPVREIATN
jgi:hypothetical protein